MAKSKTNKDYMFMYIVLGVSLVLLILSYFLMGTLLTVVMGVGIGLILLLARILDKIKNKPKQKKIFNIVMIILLIIAILICIGIVSFGAYIVMKAPAFNISMLDKKESSIFYDKDGNEITKIGSELRENVTYDDLPEVFIDALIATEDSRFFQHNGFDAPRFIKASIGQVSGNKGAGGASTLSMQVIKNTFTSTDASVIRKFTDIYLAIFKLEKNYNKEQIIEFYVNNHELGNNAWGVEQAAQTYFGKSVKDLNLSESAMLVGMFNAPTYYNPFNYPERTYKRRATVLKLMVKHGYITQAEADAANAIPIDSLLADKPTQTLEFQGYIDTVIDELINKRGINPYVTSVEVYTNMDRGRQQKLDDIFNSKTFTWVNDVIQSGVAVVEVNTGKLVAVGAGRNKTTARSFNYATQAKRQIGSAAKPIFDYGPAIEYNNWSTYTQILDSAYTYSNGVAINNSDRGYMGQMSLRNALSQSRNIPALKAFQAVDNKKIIEFAQKLGINPEISNGRIHEAHSVGAFDGTTPLQMAAAYAAFANGGTYYEPLTVNKVIYRDNGDVVNYESQATEAMSDSTAFMITDVLITAVQSGLSSGAKISGVNLAAKTGTSSFDDATKKAKGLPSDAVNDAWIVGYDPEYAVSMWYGYKEIDKNYVSKSLPVVNERGKLYRAIGNAIFNKNNKEFKVPSSVVRVGVEVGSNPATLPSASTPQEQIVYEYFIKGTEPTETSAKYNRLDTVTGLKVSYSPQKEKITITWNKLNTPAANESYGQFGYNVYYGDVLLGFTTENTYTIDANTNISGTYKVVTVFSNYSANQSNPATYKFEYSEATPVPTDDPTTTPTPTPTGTITYSLILVGDATVNLTSTAAYTEYEPAVKLMASNGTQVDISSISWVITDASGNKVAALKGTPTAPLTKGTYTITYTVNYSGKDYKITRKVVVS